MSLSLLATKLHRPPARHHLVPRARLLAQLDTGLRQGRRLSLVSAPAGFGKTTLVSAWVDAAGLACAWLALDADDNDPTRFLGYLIAALQQVDASIGSALLPLLRSVQPPPPQAIVAALITESAGRAAPLVLVLDDYHLLTEPSIHDLIGFLIENLPPTLRLVIGTREDPPLPLPRLRARSQMVEIRQRDLRFTAEEAATFLGETMGLALSSRAIGTLQTRTEGWPTGLQLAALALQSTAEQAEQFIAAFAGDDRYVMDYLLDEVLNHVPETVRLFLRQTAVLDRFTASLCDAVTGRDDSQSILDVLEASNLFLIPLDNRREWYRYHQLFADVLRLALDRDAQRDLHRRAAQWYWGHDMAEQAIQHALVAARMTGDYAQAEAWIGAATMPTLAQGALATVRGWLDAMPEQRIGAAPELALAKGWLLAMSGDLARAETYAALAHAAVQSASPDFLQRAQLLLLSGLVALLAHQEYRSAIEQVDQALAILPEASYWRLIALWIKAEATERIGPMTRAIEAFRAAQAAGRSASSHVILVTVEMALAGALNLCGRRREAIQVCEEAIARYTDTLGRVAPIAGTVLSLLGTLYYEADQLELARQAHDQALAYGQQLALPPYQIPAYGMRATTYVALGEEAAALEGLHIAMRLARETGVSDVGWLAAREVAIYMRQGDRSLPLRWAEAAMLSPDSAPHYLTIDAQIVYARLLIQEQRLDDAARLLGALRAFFQGYELYRPLLSVVLLEASIAMQQGDRLIATQLLREAIQIAAPEGYYRAFLDEGSQLLGMLHELRHMAPAFVARLVDAVDGPAPVPRTNPQPLVEPLSERELEVLALLAAGHSNAEIAERLVIAIGTVKRHINNIYGKLEVQSRTQAIAKARSIHLLDAIDA